MKKNILLLLFILCCISLFSQSKYATLLKKEVVNSDTVLWEKNTSSISAYIEKDHSKLKDCPDKFILKDSMTSAKYELKIRNDIEEFMDSFASVFVQNLNPEIIPKLMESDNKAPVVLTITVRPDGHIINVSISFRIQREDIMTSEEVYTICRYLQKNFIFKDRTEYDENCAWYSSPIKKEKFIQYFNEYLQNARSQRIKKEVVDNDTVVWWVDTNTILVHIDKNYSELKDCGSAVFKDNVRELTVRDNFEESTDSFASVFIQNLNPEVISKLSTSENKAPIGLFVTTGSDGHILDCTIIFKTQQADIMTSEEVHAICRYLQNNFSFKFLTKNDVSCASYYFPIKRGKLMINKNAGN